MGYFVQMKGNTMKINKIALLLLLVCFLPQKSFAGGSTDDSGEASGAIGTAGLSAISAPVLASEGLVALVGATGLGAIELSGGAVELSGAVIDSLFSEPFSGNGLTVDTGRGKKSIPFVVRKDYVLLNERI